MADTFERIQRELYRLPPSDFTATRDLRAAEAREHDAELASAIKKLRRPTQAAWAVNLLAWKEPRQLDDLIDVGEQLRSAQRELRGERMRQLSHRRSQLLRELSDRAAALAAEADRPLSDQAREQVEQTLNAALSETGSAESTRHGTLAKPLEYSGFGILDGTGPAPGRMTSDEPEPGQPRERDPERELTEARAEAERAARDLRRANDDLERARGTRDDREHRRAELRREIDRLDRQLHDSEGAITARQRRRDEAHRNHESLEDRVRELENELNVRH